MRSIESASAGRIKAGVDALPTNACPVFFVPYKTIVGVSINHPYIFRALIFVGFILLNH